MYLIYEGNNSRNYPALKDNLGTKEDFKARKCTNVAQYATSKSFPLVQ